MVVVEVKSLIKQEAICREVLDSEALLVLPSATLLCSSQSPELSSSTQSQVPCPTAAFTKALHVSDNLDQRLLDPRGLNLHAAKLPVAYEDPIFEGFARCP